jgi:type II secretory pathway predicted ATPase ExeA
MYEEYYGLTAKPFHITPDLDFLFLSHNHQKAITCMEYGVNEDTGITLLTGDTGIGKTTLIRHMLTKFEDDFRVATIYNADVDSKQLLGLILEAFGLNTSAKGKSKSLKLIESSLKGMHDNGQKPVIIIDDAQNLHQKTLEIIRLLSNLQNQNRMLVQIILVGQTEFKKKLEDPAMASLVQRIGITYHIVPFSRKETETYVAHRLKIAGGIGDIFDKEALEIVYTISQGNPHSVNLICDHALVYGLADDKKNIDNHIIQQVIKDNPNLAKLKDSKENQNPDQTDGTSFKSSEDTEATSTHLKKGGYENWQQRIEGRLQTLEQLMAEYNRELRDVIKSMFEKERQKNDNLMMKYAQLESESNTLRQRLAERNSDNRRQHH